MIRVLHCLGGLGTGGAETLIINWYRAIDRNEIQFDFLVRDDSDHYVEEINRLGGKIYKTSSFPRHALKNYSETKHLLKEQKWDVIHVHANAALYLTALILAKKYKIPCRVMHSHNTCTQGKLYNLCHYINRRLISFFATEQLACSTNAGKWMYGNHPFTVLKNAVDYNRFKFEESDRNEIRKKLSIEDKFVIGNVGRFAHQKNHNFLLEVFKVIKRKKDNSVLLLVGDGELENDIRKRAADLEIADSVIFYGRTQNVGAVLSAMDAFVLPSFWEGLGNVLIEAQINGLPCFVSSSAFNEEVHISDLLSIAELSNGVEKWADNILKYSYNSKIRGMSYSQFLDTGYDINFVVRELETIYKRG